MNKKWIRFFTLSLAIYCLAFSSLKAQDEIDISKYSNHNLRQLEINADLVYLQKSYAEAAQLFLKIADQNRDDGRIYYILSKCYAHLKKPALAADFLVIAVNNGFDDFRLIRSDKAFEGIRENVHFKSTYIDVLDFGRSTGGDIIYVDAQKMIKSRVFFPDDYDADKSYPLVVGLHGYGSNSNDLATVWKKLHKKSFIFVIPDAPYQLRIIDVKYPLYSWSMRIRDEILRTGSDQYTLRYIHAVTKEAKRKFKISKTILMGFSQGTSYAYGAGLKYAEEFDGLICFAGSFPDLNKYPGFIIEDDLKKNTHLKVYISHGKNDRTDLKYSRNAARILKKNKYTVKLEITDLKHIISEGAFRNALNWHGI